MTPEQAEEIYHQARLKAFYEAADYCKPAVQAEVNRKGWEAVVEAIKAESSREIAQAMLDKGCLNDRT